jgi:hypothetical protein
MTAKIQAIVLGGLACVAAFCSCVCLCFPACVVVAILEGDLDDHRSQSAWDLSTILFIVTLIISILVGLRMGWRVGHDWYQKGDYHRRHHDLEQGCSTTSIAT